MTDNSYGDNGFSTISLMLTTANEGDCSPWFFHDADNGTECVCSKVVSDKVVRRDKDTTAFLRISVYMTYNSETEDTQIGPCPYILQHFNFSSGIYYFHLPKHTSNLTSFMCDPLHRKVCCVGSVRMVLVQHCTPTHWSARGAGDIVWGGFCISPLHAVIPTKVLHFIVVVFRVSVTSLPLNVFILFCHLTVYTFCLQPDLYILIESEWK